MIKKFILFVLSALLVQNIVLAKDTVTFTFPNEGWHKVASPDGVASKVCYVPQNQSSENYSEMVTFMQKAAKNSDLSPSVIMIKQLGKDRNNYYDIIPEYVVQDQENTIVTWCSKAKNTCVIERAFRGQSGIVLAIYTNKAPHYSQNIFGQWVNNLGRMEIYNPSDNTQKGIPVQL